MSIKGKGTEPALTTQPYFSPPSGLNEILEEYYIKENGETGLRRYLKSRFLGKGGFAKCYEVKNLSTGEILAAKIIDKSTLTKVRTQQKLLSEIKIHKSMKHPGIVRFEGYFEDSKRAYILLEMCPNQTLKEIVKRRKKLHELEVQCYLYQIIPVLRYIHGMYVIHRDLKLGNLFLGKNMELKVGDFGLAAKLNSSFERRRTICGTPNYIAPEVLGSKVLGHSFEADIWSLGVVVYTMLVGRPPFETANVRQTYKRIKANDYHIPESLGISDAARGLIHRILVVNPAKRPSLEEIMNDRFMTRNPIPPLMPLTTLVASPPEDFVKHYSVQRGSEQQSETEVNLKKSSLESTAPTSSIPHLKLNPLDTENLVFTKTFQKPSANTARSIVKAPSQHCLNPQALGPMKSPLTSRIKTAASTNCLVRTEDPGFAYVEYYLDYMDKYGVGYVLTNGIPGFYFNDMTNLLAIAYTGQYGYSDYYPPGKGENMKFLKIAEYPVELSKKVKIMQHFISYYNKLKESNMLHTSGKSLPEVYSGVNLVAVKRVIKSRNGLCVRLTNGTCQTFFTDRSQIVLNMRKRQMVYIDKKGAKEVLNAINHATIHTNENIAKRYMYTISLLNLFNSHKIALG